MRSALPGTDSHTTAAPLSRLDHEPIIVGSGFSGVGAAVALEKMGIEDLEGQMIHSAQ